MKRQLSINFAPRQGGRCGGGVNLEIFDVESSTNILSIELTHEEAGKFVTSQGITVSASVSDHLDRIGLTYKVTNIAIPALKDMTGLTGQQGRDIVTRAAAPYESHGWKVNAATYIASQKHTTQEGIPLVPFYRYVKE